MEIFNPAPQSVPEITMSEPTPIVSPENSAVRSGNVHGFLFIVQFFALSMLATSVGTLFFQLINHYIEDPLLSGIGFYTESFSSYAIKYGIASVIVVAPVYFILAFILNRYLQNGDVSYASRVRKVIISIVMVVASLTLLIDIISLIFNFLSGDYSGRFVPKVLIVFIIGIVVLAYYSVELIRESYTETTALWNRIFFGFALVLSLVPLIWSFFIVDGPSSTRDKQSDDQTITKMTTIKSNISLYYETSGSLPTSLNDITSASGAGVKGGVYLGQKLSADAIKGVTYTKISATGYKLCAVFRAATDTTKNAASMYTMYDYNAEWKHEKGEQCFDQTVDSVMRTYPSNHTYQPINMDTVPSVRTTPFVKPAVAATFAAASSAVPQGILCQDKAGEILSGTAGGYFCKNDASLLWPTMDSACGTGAQWVVKNGDKSNWDFVINCPAVPECSGPQNMICSESGCTSPSKTCTSS